MPVSSCFNLGCSSFLFLNFRKQNLPAGKSVYGTFTRDYRLVWGSLTFLLWIEVFHPFRCIFFKKLVSPGNVQYSTSWRPVKFIKLPFFPNLKVVHSSYSSFRLKKSLKYCCELNIYCSITWKWVNLDLHEFKIKYW